VTRVLSVTSEAVPLIKTGGLADVAGALPAALAPLGIDMRTLLPGYPAVLAGLPGAEVARVWDRLFGGPARLLAGTAGGAAVCALDAPHLYARPGGPYQDAAGRDWPDNDIRFAALCRAAADIAADGAGGWRPQALHLHDWQAGLAPLYLRRTFPQGPRPGTLMTIHNIAFAGDAAPARMAALELPEDGYTPDGFEFYGRISTLKAGLVWADRISTVSPTYAAEITRPGAGGGLDGLLRAREGVLSGILNGIDTGVWAPPYATPRGKSRHKAALRREFALPDGDGPLCIVIARLTWQKGIDLLAEALPALLGRGGQLIVLGTGELAPAMQAAAGLYRNMAVRIGHDEALARRLLAGADAILVPSRFEPCGLTQLLGLRFGALPLVALTGGLADTVIAANDAALRRGVATGFAFAPGDRAALEHALAVLCATFRQPETWARMQANAMRHPVGWETSAPHYAALFAGIAAS
jgi:starch synthase